MSILGAILWTIGSVLIAAGAGWLFVLWMFGPNDVNRKE